MSLYYFDLLEVPVSFMPDLSLLRKNYYRLSRETHPDHLSSNGDEGAQIENLSKSGDINAAYRTLADENLRTKYILEGVGLLGDVETAPVDQDFLMEMMEINELVEELQFVPDKENYKSILETIDSKQSDLDSLMKEKVVCFENQLNTQYVLEDIRDIFLKSRYLLRIRENIINFATP
ncbi:MAG: Fe-S protein assembly co-chaperone HscB [Saprospiraceae bacterium]